MINNKKPPKASVEINENFTTMKTLKIAETSSGILTKTMVDIEIKSSICKIRDYRY